MTSLVAEQHLRCNNLYQVWDHDPGATTPIVTSPDGGTTQRWVDMRDYRHFGVMAIQTIIGSSSGITQVEIVAASDTAGTDLTVIKDSGTVDADALADWLMLECAADEIGHAASAAGKALRYVAARLTQSNSGDEAIVVYTATARRPHLDLTPATSIS